MSDTPETDAAWLEQKDINAAVALRQKLAQTLVELDNMQEQCDLAMKVIKRIGNVLCKTEKERDEAREDAQKSKAYKRVLKITNENLKRERDEAREAFKEMWRSGDAFLPHVDSETINRWRKAAGWEETK
jgi:quinol monooxygenase YgiN